MTSLPEEELASRLAGLPPGRRALLERRPDASAAIPHVVSDGEAAPLTRVQRQIWTAGQLASGAAVYNLPYAFRIRGPLQAGALRRALTEVVRLHPSLRTVYRELDGEPVQVALPPGIFSVREAGLPGDEDVTAQWIEREAGTPFDLAGEPKLRATLLCGHKGGPDESLLLLTLHHLSCDGPSAGVLLHALSAAYAAYASGRDPELPEPAVSQADYAVWEREHQTPGSLRARLDRAAGHLRDEPPPLELPADRRRPATASFRGRAHAFTLPDGLASRLAAVGQAHGATLISTLITAYQVLLYRFTGQDQVRIGLAVALRDRPELEHLVACLINNVVLSGDLADDPAFGDALRRLHAESVRANADREVPFPMLADELKTARDPSRNPVFQTMFALSDAIRLELAGCEVQPLHTHSGTSEMDLTLVMERDGHRLRGFFEYATDLFDEATIASLAASWAVLLDSIADGSGVAADSGQAVSRLPLLTPGQRDAQLAAGRPRRDYPATVVPAAVAAQAARRPEAPAVSCGDQVLTYAELTERAGRLARRLRRAGVGRGTPVAVCLDRSADIAPALLGVWRAGGVQVPLDPAFPDERVRFVLDDTGAPAVVTGRDATDRSVFAGVEVVPADDAGGGGDPGPADALPDDGPGPDDLAYVIYTSGSTGRPKGVRVYHRNLARLFPATAEWFSFGPGDRWTVFHSFAFDFSVWELWGALVHGGCAVIVPHETSRSPRDFHELLARERITVLNQTPSAFRQLQAAEQTEPGLSGLPDLRLVIFGGEALDPGLLRPWLDRHGDARPRLVNMFGITETTVHVTGRPIGRAEITGGRGSVIGEPIGDLGVLLLDRNGEPVPPGAPGELYVTGAGVTGGYLNRPREQDARFRPGPPGTGIAYRTGDRARRSGDGDLVYLGRIDDQVQLHGYRIEPGEVEAALRDLPSVLDAAVTVREDRLAAYIVPAAGTRPEPVGLRRALAATLPAHLVPTVIQAVERLPMTANGKLDLRALPTLPAPPAPPASAAPGGGFADDREAVIAKTWSEVIGIDGVGPEDSFFDVGGDSLLLTRVYARLQTRLDPAPSMVDLLRYPTVRGLAAHLAARLVTEDGDGEAAREELERAARRRRMSRDRRPASRGDGR